MKKKVFACLFFLIFFVILVIIVSNKKVAKKIIIGVEDIYEDVTNKSEDVEKTDDPKTIYTSEFGNRVMELVNTVFQKNITISDGTGTNSYTWNINKENATADSCKIVSKVAVKTDADFSQLVGYADTEEPSDDNKQPDKNNNTAQEEQKKTNTNTENDKAKNDTDKTDTSKTNTPGKTNNANSNTKIYPKTGFENFIITAIFSLGIAIIIFGVKNRKYKDI